MFCDVSFWSEVAAKKPTSCLSAPAGLAFAFLIEYHPKCFLGRVYDEVPLMMFDDDDAEIKCVKGVADGICRFELGS